MRTSRRTLRAVIAPLPDLMQLIEYIKDTSIALRSTTAASNQLNLSFRQCLKPCPRSLRRSSNTKNPKNTRFAYSNLLSSSSLIPARPRPSIRALRAIAVELKTLNKSLLLTRQHMEYIILSLVLCSKSVSSMYFWTFQPS